MNLRGFAIVLLASAGLATPIRKDVDQVTYTLRLSSRFSSLDGRYLSANGTLLGVYGGGGDGTQAQAVRFYPVESPATGLWELRTAAPRGEAGALALIGVNGLLDFARLEDPAAVEVPEGGTLDWRSFRLDGGEDGNALEYAGEGQGVWVAFPNSANTWSVKWKDDNAWTTADYIPVDVVYEPVSE